MYVLFAFWAIFHPFSNLSTLFPNYAFNAAKCVAVIKLKAKGDDVASMCLITIAGKLKQVKLRSLLLCSKNRQRANS